MGLGCLNPGKCNCEGEWDCTTCEPTDLVITGILSPGGCCATDMQGTYPLSFSACSATRGLAPSCELEPSITGEYGYGIAATVQLIAPGEVQVVLRHSWTTSTEFNEWVDIYLASIPIIDGCPSSGTYSIAFDSRIVVEGVAKCSGNLGVSLVYP